MSGRASATAAAINNTRHRVTSRRGVATRATELNTKPPVFAKACAANANDVLDAALSPYWREPEKPGRFTQSHQSSDVSRS
jgi:hypothetical protein